MVVGAFYVFTTSTNAWIAQGSSPTANVGDGSTLVPAGTVVYLCGDNGATLSVIRDTADGACSLSPAKYF
jgi:hypothetical protein